MKFFIDITINCVDEEIFEFFRSTFSSLQPFEKKSEKKVTQVDAN